MRFWLFMALLGGCSGGAPDMVEDPASACAGKCDGYGTDDRQELYEASASIAAYAHEAVTVINRSQMVVASDGELSLHPSPGVEALNLCPGQRFRGEPSVGVASGIWVGKDIVVGAGHTFAFNSCSNVAVVFNFGYYTKANDLAAVTHPAVQDVYYCKEVLYRSYSEDNTAPDIAIVRLDRAVTGRTPATYSHGAPPQAGQGLFVVGSPYGLPLKASSGNVQASLATPKGLKHPDEVAALSKDIFFFHDVDTAPGNSGSPVFDRSTGEVVGIHVRGPVQSETLPTSKGCSVWAFCGVNQTCYEYNAATNLAPFSEQLDAYLAGP